MYVVIVQCGTQYKVFGPFNSGGQANEWADERRRMVEIAARANRDMWITTVVATPLYSPDRCPKP